MDQSLYGIGKNQNGEQVVVEGRIDEIEDFVDDLLKSRQLHKLLLFHWIHF